MEGGPLGRQLNPDRGGKGQGSAPLSLLRFRKMSGGLPFFFHFLKKRTPGREEEEANKKKKLHRP